MKISKSYTALFCIIFCIALISFSNSFINTNAKTPKQEELQQEEQLSEPEIIKLDVSPTEALRKEKNSETKKVIASNFGSSNEIPPEPEYRILVCGQGFPTEETSFSIFDYYDYESERAFHVENGVIEELEGINFSDYDICLSAYSTEYIE